MKFPADEICAGPVMFALRQAGHDVLAIAEIEKRAVDEGVIERALSERRVGKILLTRMPRGAGVRRTGGPPFACETVSTSFLRSGPF